MICSKCGTENSTDVKFCSYCGNDLSAKKTEEVNAQPQVQNVAMSQSLTGQQVVTKKKFNILESLKKLDKKKLIIIIVAIVAVIVLFKLIFGSNVKSYEELFETDSFFLSDNNGKYALFNESGKKLTAFEFDNSATFFNGSAYVRNSDGKYALINEKGKFLVDYNDYTSIVRSGPLYLAIDAKYETKLLNAKGKKVETLEKAESLDLSSSGLVSVVKYEDEYKIYNYKGKSILKFDRVLDEKDLPSLSSYGQYVSVFYNGKTYVVDAVKGKKLVSFISESKYCIESINEDNEDLYILKSCGTGSSNEKSFKLVKKKKVLYEKVNSACTSMSFAGENVICDTKDGEVILDKKGNEVLNVEDGVAFIDSETYAKNSESSTAVEFYKKGKLKKTVNCLKLSREGYIESGVYLLATTYDSACNTRYGTYQYFKENGEALTKEQFTSATSFDDNGLAVVSVNSDDYYLINKKGKKVSSAYDRIGYATGEYYVATISSDIKVLINTKGKEIVKAEDIDVDMIAEDEYYAVLEHANDTYAVYNVNKKKEIIKLDSEPTLSEHYFRTSKDGKKQYYTYKKGKLFHEA